MNMPRLTESSVLQEDLEHIVAADCVDWNRLRGGTILVTGATGLIGGILTRALAMANSARGLGMSIIAGCRNRAKADAMLDNAYAYGVIPIVWDVCKPSMIDGPVDHIIHAAADTASRTMVERPVETVQTILAGTRNVLELARAKSSQDVVLLSSMEVYGRPRPDQTLLRETDYGDLDPLVVRSGYPEAKRMAENMVAAYATEYKVKAKIVRLVQTFGAGTAKDDHRVFAQLAREALAGRDVTLHTDGSSARCYCYTTDAVTGILTVLLRGKIAQAYNVGNEDAFASIREMAQMIADAAGVGMTFDMPASAAELRFPPSARLKISCEKMHTLGWSPTTSMPDMVKRLMMWMKEEK